MPTKTSKKNKAAGKIKIFCDLRKCTGCKSCEIACAVEHSFSKDLVKALRESVPPTKRVRIRDSFGRAVRISCQHCEEAPCVAACMSGAMYKDPKTGATKHDKDKCVGCWMCIMVCPFGAIVRSIEDKQALKCDLCPDRDDYACVIACPTGALFAGTPEEFKRKAEKKL